MIHFEQQQLPIIGEQDAIIVGGSLGGVATALTLAERGRRVAVIEPRTFLGYEITATLRPWLSADAELDPLWTDLLTHCATEPVESEIPLRLNALKKRLEDLLLSADIQLLYGSFPVGLHYDEEGRLAGVIVGNKSGRQLVTGHLIIDATANGAVAGLTLPESSSTSSTPTTITIEFDRVQPLSERTINVPHGIIKLHAGAQGKGHWFADCFFEQPNMATDSTAAYLQARQLAFDTAVHLIQNHPAFSKATLATIGYALWPCEQDGRSLQPRGSRSQESIWRLQNTDPHHAPCNGSELGRWLDENWEDVVAAKSADSLLQSTADPAIIKTLPSPQRGRAFPIVQVPPTALPILQETEVLIVGGGSSGAMAAIAAARQGAKTTLIDFNPALGGTGTYGGVHSYWFGRRVGFSAEITTYTATLQTQLGEAPPSGNVPRWNIEAKTQAWLNLARDAGVNLLFNAAVFGTVVENKRVHGVAVATPDGVGVINATVVVDATGDGDIAAHAGADFVYGTERDHTVMWYSLAQFPRPGRTRNNFTSMADVSNTLDYTRAILAGRRREREKSYEHGIYVAPRESRHIRGEITLTLTDQLLRRAWPDVVNITFSNHDVKGHSDSDWLKIGLIPPNLEVEIPYRALVPHDLDGLLIVGKAISATHDALPAIRMQPDMENLGGVVGMAAAATVHTDVLPRHLDVRRLQAELVAHGILPEKILTRQLQSWQPDIPALVQALAEDRAWHSYSDMGMTEVFDGRIPLVDLCCAGVDAVVALTDALSDYTGDARQKLAMALALVGSADSVPTLLTTIESQLTGDALPERDTHILYAGTPPDQGAMPQLVYTLYALALTQDRRALPIWQRVVDLLKGVSAEDVADGRQGIFHYVETVCAGTERLGDRAAIPLLQQLHSYAPLHNLVCQQRFQVDYFDERRAHLELVIGRALARCGSAHGYIILINYLADTRALLAEHAHSELVRLAGLDLGKSMTAWSAWLERYADQLEPLAWNRQTAARLAWHQKICVEKPSP